MSTHDDVVVDLGAIWGRLGIVERLRGSDPGAEWYCRDVRALLSSLEAVERERDFLRREVERLMALARGDGFVGVTRPYLIFKRDHPEVDWERWEAAFARGDFAGRLPPDPRGPEWLKKPDRREM